MTLLTGIVADAFQKAKDNFGRLDIVVNNAGIADERDASWERCILINLVSMFVVLFMPAKLLAMLSLKLSKVCFEVFLFTLHFLFFRKLRYVWYCVVSSLLLFC